MTATKKSDKRGIGSAIGSGIITFVMLILLGLAVALFLIPKVMGGMSLTVLTGSMEPAIHPGDVVVTSGISTDQARDLTIGDVIVFLPYPDDPMLVTHRIIAKSVGQEGTSFETQGDNNNAPDTWNPVHDYQVRGKVVYVVPKIGYVREWVGGSVNWILLGLAGVLILYAAWSFISSFRKDKEPSEDGDERQGIAQGGNDDDSTRQGLDKEGTDQETPSPPQRAIVGD